MKTQVILSEPLADLCRHICRRCAPDGGDAAPGGSPFLLDEPQDGPLAAIRKRRISLPQPRCERCEFLLLMLAIEHLVPAEVGVYRRDPCLAAAAWRMGTSVGFV